MTNHNKQPYNTVPHYIVREYRRDELSINQLRVLFWLRAIGTPYGIATTSLTDLKNDVFPDIELKINTINAMLLKLRQKQHIFYEPRQGKSGTFEIQLNHWFMPKNKYKTLDKFFPEPKQWMSADGETIVDAAYPQVNPSEANQTLRGQNQKLAEQKERLVKGFSFDSSNRQIRSSHNEQKTEIETKIENSSTPVRGKQRWNEIPTFSFTPKNDEEERCKEIASDVGEKYMDYLLSRLKLKYGGIKVIEEGYESFLEAMRVAEAKNDPVENPPALFNKCIQNAISDNEMEQTGR